MNYKISFCTVCMNRLHHLKQTLPQNIKDSLSYPNVEFVVMDYNSSDGLEQWIQSEMKEYIEQGVLVYFKTSDPEFFNRSHSRNLMFKNATGDIVCNLDADNFTGVGFAEYIQSVFAKNPNTILIPDTKRRYYYIRDAIGRFCAMKKDFLLVSGYDEEMAGYGFEDDDLYERFLALDRKEVVITDLRFLNALRHNDEERVKNEFYANNLAYFFISYRSPLKSEVLFLYKDSSFERGVVMPNTFNTPAHLIENLIWEKGKWNETTTGFSLLYTNQEQSQLNLKEGSSGEFIDSKNRDSFFKITDQSFLNFLSIQLPLITNQGKFHFNQKNKKGQGINASGFGQGVVYKNFSKEKIVVN